MAVQLRVLHLSAILEVDREAMKVIVGGEWIPLSLNRYRALCLFLDHPGEMLSHAAIFEASTGHAYPSRDREQLASDVRTLVFYLRRILAGSGVRFVPLRGFGYRLELQEGPHDAA